jgi:flagellar biosynthesis protein FliR
LLAIQTGTRFDIGILWINKFRKETRTLFDFINAGTAQLELFLLVLIRCTGVLLTAPIIGHRALPAMVKVGLVILLSITVTATLPASSVEVATSLSTLILLVVRELIVGAIIGLFFSFIFYGIQLAGTAVGYQIGFAIANILDPNTSEQTPIIGQFWSLLGMLILLSINGHHLIISAFVDSYQSVGPGMVILDGSIGEAIMKYSQDVFVIALKLAAPIVVALLLTDVALGIISRAIPTLNVFFIGAPLKIAVGLVLIAMSLPLFGYVLERGWQLVDDQIHTIINGMGKA